MLKLRNLAGLLTLVLMFASPLLGAIPSSTPALPLSENTSTQTQEENTKFTFERFKQTWVVTYFTYVFGPGLHPDQMTYYPNQLGNPDNDGIYFQNQVSVRYKFSKNLAIDFQSRFKIVLNNYEGQNKDFSVLRWETPRIGISGVLLSGNDWSLTGAVNTDFPYFFPAPFSGNQAKGRKVLFTPGMFAGFKYEPKNSRWSIFSVISPRYLFYADRNVAEESFKLSGLDPQNKPELIISIQPTVNYRLSQKYALTVGTTLDYRKHVISSWNPFNATLITNGPSSAWRFNAIPINVGINCKFSNAFTLFPFISTFPIAAQRINAKTGAQASMLEATALGMWVSGTLF